MSKDGVKEVEEFIRIATEGCNSGDDKGVAAIPLGMAITGLDMALICARKVRLPIPDREKFMYEAFLECLEEVFQIAHALHGELIGIRPVKKVDTESVLKKNKGGIDD